MVVSIENMDIMILKVSIAWISTENPHITDILAKKESKLISTVCTMIFELHLYDF